MNAPYPRHAEAIDHVRKTLSIHNSHVTLRNSNTGEVHILEYDSDQPEQANLHFRDDCPGEGLCPRWHPNG